jgi:imidazolonepropionase-like amidohydrolase
MGAKIALGSDAGAYAVAHGQGLFHEMKHLQKIGLNGEELEKMCSENGAKALKLDVF